MTRDESYFDRTFRAGLRRPRPKVEVTVVVCSGKCRKHAVDPNCQLHSGGRA